MKVKLKNLFTTIVELIETSKTSSIITIPSSCSPEINSHQLELKQHAYPATNPHLVVEALETPAGGRFFVQANHLGAGGMIKG